MAQLDRLIQARQGNPAAIATILAHSLQTYQVQVKAKFRDGALHLVLEAEAVPSWQIIGPFLHQQFYKLAIPNLALVQVYSRPVGSLVPEWAETLTLNVTQSAAIQGSKNHTDQNLDEIILPPNCPAQQSEADPLISEPPASSSLASSGTRSGSRSSLPPSSSTSPPRKSQTGVGSRGKVVPFRTFQTQPPRGKPRPTANYGTQRLVLAVLLLQVGGIGALLAWGNAQKPPKTAVVSPASEGVSDEQTPTVSLADKQVFTAVIKREIQGIPVIDVQFNDGPTFEMIVDTGASSTLITQEMAMRLQVVPIGQVTSTIADGSQVSFPVGYVKSISVDGAAVRNVQVVIADQMQIGLLGHDFFDNFDIKIKRDVVEFHRRTD